MFNNEYYKILLGDPVRYQDGECIAEGYVEGEDCEKFKPVSGSNFSTRAIAGKAAWWTDELMDKWKSSDN